MVNESTLKQAIMAGRIYNFIFCVVMLGVFGDANSQEKFERSGRMQTDTFKSPYSFRGYFDGLFESSVRKYGFEGKTENDFHKWQHAFLPVLKDAIGLIAIENKFAAYVPRAEMKESLDDKHFILQKWFIWTEPDVPLPVVVLIPKNKPGKLPVVITTHGHGRDSILYDGIYPRIYSKNDSEMSLALQAVNLGYIAIAPTMRAFGSTRFEGDLKAGNSFSCHTQLMRDLLVGRTVIGDRVWDMSKVLDWALKTLPVDGSKVAITGNSGGGTVSLFAAACDNRIKVAVPSSYFCTFKGSIGSIAHCDCNYIPNILNLGEMSDIGGLIAPRPLRIVHGVKDNIYPIGETRMAFAALQNIYAASGYANRVDLYEGAEGHKYYKEGSWPFIRKYFDSVDVQPVH